MKRALVPLVGLIAAHSFAGGPVVCIDPGHPSEVGRGTHGRKTTELHLNWVLAVKLAKKLRADGYRVVMTKAREGQRVLNKRRAEVANEAGADLMIRIHCDASRGTGFTVYTPDRQGTVEGVTGPSEKVLERSTLAGHLFHDAFAKTLGGYLRDGGLLPDTRTAVGGKQGALTGSIFSQVPVVLIETCVLTNPKDEDYMLSAKGQALVVAGLVAGVEAAAPKGRKLPPLTGAGRV